MRHVKSSDHCKQSYYERFGVSSQKTLTDKIDNLRRQSQNSRQPTARSLENSNKKSKLASESKTRPAEVMMNKFLASTSFSNYKVCILCKKNIGENQGEEVYEDSDLVQSGEIDVQSLKHMKRFNKLWKCVSPCQAEEARIMTAMRVLEQENRIILHVPADERNEAEDSEEVESALSENVVVATNSQVPSSSPIVTQTDDLNNDYLTFETILRKLVLSDPRSKDEYLEFPCSSAALIGTNAKDLRPNLLKNVAILMYRNKNLSIEDYELMYQYQLAKFSKKTNIFYGAVSSNEQKVLSSVSMISSDHEIRGTYSWEEIRCKELMSRIKQLGDNCMVVSVRIPMVNPETLATCLTQMGIVVTVEYEGLSSQRLKRRYAVHKGHQADEECGVNCSKYYLHDVADFEELSTCKLHKMFLSTYICDVDLKLKELVKQFFKCSSFELSSSNYEIQVNFNQDQEAQIIGVFWPEFFKDLNILPVSHDQDCKVETEKQALVDLDRCTTTTNDPRELSRNFNFSKEDAESIAQMVNKHQLHMCRRGTCTNCSSAPLPSLRTAFSRPCKVENLTPVKQFHFKMKNLFTNLAEEKVISSSTEQWLEEIYSNRVLESNAEGGKWWKIKIDDQTFKFFLEESLQTLISKYGSDNLLPFYQFVIECYEDSQDNRIILKRTALISSYIVPYNPTLLLTFSSRVLVKPFEGIAKFEMLKSFVSEEEEDFTEKDGHRIMPIIEALSLMDPNKFKFTSSQSSQYINCGPDVRPTFMKVSLPTDTSFQLQGSRDHYEVQTTFLKRYFMRRNGLRLFLCEVASHYDYAGKEKSEEKLKVFDNRLDLIPDSQDKALVEELFLPEILVMENGDVLVKRKNMKILSYPAFDEESLKYKHVMLMLFSMHGHSDGIPSDQIETLYGDGSNVKDIYR